MPGVTFSRKSGQRISAAVRKIEQMPLGQQNLQRRRAGGLGRSTLWEVTAVQTGPGTVTINRVSNIAFDLNDPSEKVDILFDPANEPAVGDRGLLIRLGEGNLFFFRPAVGVNRIFIDKISTVIPALPDTTFLDTGTAIIITPVANTQIGIFKFASALPTISGVGSSAIIDDAILSLKKTALYGNTSRTISASKKQFLNIVPKIIQQDFDITNLTYNIYTGLDVFAPTPFVLQELREVKPVDSRITLLGLNNLATISTRESSPGPDDFMRAFFNRPGKQAYGFAIELAWQTGAEFEGGNFNWNMNLIATEHGGFMSYIEWGI